MKCTYNLTKQTRCQRVIGIVSIEVTKYNLKQLSPHEISVLFVPKLVFNLQFQDLFFSKNVENSRRYSFEAEILLCPLSKKKILET